MQEKKARYLVFAVFAFIGLIFTVVGIIVAINTFDYSDIVETTGIITSIKSYKHDDEVKHKVQISHVIDGKLSLMTLNPSSKSMA